VIGLAKRARKVAIARPALVPVPQAEEFPEETRSKITLLLLITLFTALGALIYLGMMPANIIYIILVTCAVVWCLAELRLNRAEPDRIVRAAAVGLFLMVFDFGFQNSGWLLGLWTTHNSAIAIGIVPVEVMLVCLIGGTAWALYLPRNYSRLHSVMDILVFATYGALGEYMLGVAGLMSYYQWWNPGWAFLAYGITWIVLHFVKYRVVRV